jgi:16S rRNA (cytosine967-C5)-methyltransferase
LATAARRVAYGVLRDVERGGTTLADRLAQADAQDLWPRDRAFVHELVLGTLRLRGAIDFALAPLLQRDPLARLDPAVRTVLRLGAHQVLHLRVPDRAAVSESVDLVRAHAPRAGGLVNAVLRRLAREGPPSPPDPVREALAWLTRPDRFRPGWPSAGSVVTAPRRPWPVPAPCSIRPRPPFA